MTEDRMDRSWQRIAVIGIGYVGLPVSLAFAEAGIQVRAIDCDTGRVAELRAGRSFLTHIPDQRVAAMRQADRLLPDADASAVADCQAVLLCVPTPLTPTDQPDLSAVEAAIQAIAPHLGPGTLVVLESTSWPGTAAELVTPLLEVGSGLRLGEGLFVASSPEREDPGNPDWSTRTIPKLVGGVDPRSGELAVSLYSTAIDQVVPCRTAAIAEMAKLYENVFRNVNIALACEVEQVIQASGADFTFTEVLAAAATKPFGFMPFYAGIGVGGPCIPVSPHYLKHWVQRHGDTTPLIDQALAVNGARPAVIAERIRQAQQGDATTALPDLTAWQGYKPGVADQRNNPRERVEGLLGRKART